LANSMPPVASETTGLGLVCGEEQVVYLPVVRTPRLTLTQRTVRDEVRVLCSGEQEFYHPNLWVPHITLGRWEASKNVAGDVVRYLSNRELVRPIPLNNIAVLEEQGE